MKITEENIKKAEMLLANKRYLKTCVKQTTGVLVLRDDEIIDARIMFRASGCDICISSPQISDEQLKKLIDMAIRMVEKNYVFVCKQLADLENE